MDLGARHPWDLSMVVSPLVLILAHQVTALSLGFPRGDPELGHSCYFSLRTFPRFPSHLEYKLKSSQWPISPCRMPLQHRPLTSPAVWFPFPHSAPATPSSLWFLTHTTHAPPQGLCTGCSLGLGFSAPRWPPSLLPHLWVSSQIFCCHSIWNSQPLACVCARTHGLSLSPHLLFLPHVPLWYFPLYAFLLIYCTYLFSVCPPPLEGQLPGSQESAYPLPHLQCPEPGTAKARGMENSQCDSGRGAESPRLLWSCPAPPGPYSRRV